MQTSMAGDMGLKPQEQDASITRVLMVGLAGSCGKFIFAGKLTSLMLLHIHAHTHSLLLHYSEYPGRGKSHHR